MINPNFQLNIPMLRKGDLKAYEALYNEFFGVLFHLCLNYLHDLAYSCPYIQQLTTAINRIYISHFPATTQPLKKIYKSCSLSTV